jgi:molecular chaperone DnaK
VLYGLDAKESRALDAANTIYSAKRLIGQSVRTPLVQLAMTALPFRVEEGPNQQPIVLVRGRRMTIPEVSGLILGNLKGLAEQQLGQEVTHAVLTVPANFTDAQRKGTKEAGRLAGLEVLRLVNEPTAAALAYGYGHQLDELVAIFDFGGGTFDISISAATISTAPWASTSPPSSPAPPAPIRGRTRWR